MSLQHPATMVDQLGEYLLRLGRLAREVPAPDFLGQAVALLRELIPFRSGWWGLATDNVKDKIPSIHQAEFICLPDDFADEWKNIALLDDFGDDVREHIGEVTRYVGGEKSNQSPAIVAFDQRYDIVHCMALTLNTTGTGHMFFIVLYRGRGDAPFTDDEATLFLHLLRHTIQLQHFSLQDALSAASKDVCIGRAALARPDGRLLYAGHELCELFYAKWPEWEGLALPDEVIAQLGATPCTLHLPGGVVTIRAQGEHIWLTQAEPGAPDPLLSPRERRVALLFAAGHSYKEIARMLNLTPATVRTYLRDAYLRLGVNNKIQLGNVLSGE